MSILDRLFKSHGSNKDDDIERIPNLQVGNDGETTLYADDVVDYITKELEDRREKRCLLELQWTLNANFLIGNQNCDVDTTSRKIKIEERVETRDRERRVYNRIAPLMETRHANLKSVNYDMVVNPRSAELDDYAKAQISTKLLRYCQNVTDFNKKKDTMIQWAELTGTCFSMSYWNTEKGETVGIVDKEMIDENGEHTVLHQDLRSGDIDFGILSSYEVFPASLNIQEISDQHDIIIEQVRDVGEVYDMYGIRVDGETVDSYVLTPVLNGVTGHGKINNVIGLRTEERENAVKVITYLENPSRDYPEGRTIIIIRDKIIFYGDLPGGIMPIVAFKSKPVAGQFFGKSVIEDLIPLQRTYNNIENKINDFIDTLANNPWLIPEGSVKDIDELASKGVESGSAIVYDSTFGAPAIVEYPNPPSVIVNEKQSIASDMEYVAGVSQLMVYGATPTGVESGTAIERLREIDSTRMSLTADNIRDGVVDMSKIWLALNKKFSTGYRTIEVAGHNDVGFIFTWCSDDINSYDLMFTAENQLRHSPEAQKQEFLQAYQMGMFMDSNGTMSKEFRQRAWKMFCVGDLSDVLETDDLQRKAAQRENTYVSQGVLPEHGDYDDDEIHVDEHTRFALTSEYRMLKDKFPEYTVAFDNHVAQHRAIIEQKQQAAMAQQMQMQAAGYGSAKAR